ncbi:glycosyltransferase family 4 protein [Streptomyces sp. NPDC088923]|uniref:glycosyltransferase family 4 protein n=1 Tax=Streptomyces sp. NPDC088923 TaxID=3365913 RepID=UPI0037F92CA2
MKLSFLINNIYGIGGTNRTVINLAEALSARHEVEIVSVFQRAATPQFTISPAVRVRSLLDTRPGRPDRAPHLASGPSEVVPQQEEYYSQYTRFSDERLREELRGTDADVVIGTRPSLNLFVAAHTADRALRVAQEHMTHLAIPPAVRAAMAAVYPRLDAISTVTEADARSFREHTPVAGVPVVAIPNSVPRPRVAPSDGTARVVVSAGRLHHVKRYDLLVRAFALLAPDFPDWHLRIYGTGEEQSELGRLIRKMGLDERVLLMGGHSPIESEWAKGSVAAVTSSAESFGMTLVEAMRCGLPVVSTDCPVGPREILRHGEDGLLVANGDVTAIADGLGRLMGDDVLRKEMSAAALRNSERYDPEHVADLYTRLFEEAGARRASSSRGYRAPSASSGRRFGRSHLLREAGEAEAYVEPGGAVRLSVAAPHDGRHRRRLFLRATTKDEDGGRLCLPLETRHEDRGHDRTTYTAVVGPETVERAGEGTWQVLLGSSAEDAVPLRAGVRDTRELLAARQLLLVGGRSGPRVRWTLPYAHRNGRLLLRTLDRTEHIECARVQVGPGEVITVTARVCGSGPEPGPGSLFVLDRRGTHPDRLTVPVELVSPRVVRAVLPVRELIDRRLEDWEDWEWGVLLHGADPEPRPVCHMLEDFADVKSVLIHPTLVADGDVEGPHLGVYGSAPVRVRPYCSSSGRMALNVVER